jgi:hypothetical protein
MSSDADIHKMIMQLLNARSDDSSICPSEAARALHAEEAQWRALMPVVHNVARQMAREGLLQITQKHKPVNPDSDMRGPIRISKKSFKGKFQ